MIAFYFILPLNFSFIFLTSVSQNTIMHLQFNEDAKLYWEKLESKRKNKNEMEL